MSVASLSALIVYAWSIDRNSIDPNPSAEFDNNILEILPIVPLAGAASGKGPYGFANRSTYSMKFIEGFGLLCSVFKGQDGICIAYRARENLHPLLVKHLKRANDDITIKTAFETAFKTTNERCETISSFERVSYIVRKLFCKYSPRKIMPPDGRQGSSATTIFIRNSRLHVAHIGNARAVLCSGSGQRALTCDHNVDNSSEFARVRTFKGFGTDTNFPSYFANEATSGASLVSRSFGKTNMRPAIIAIPEVASLPITTKDEFCIIASDGVWNAAGDQEAHNIITQYLQKNPSNYKGAADALVQYATKKADSRDGATAIVIDLKPFHPSPTQ